MRLPKVDDVYYWATPYGTDHIDTDKEDRLCIVTRGLRPEDSTYAVPGRYACGRAPVYGVRGGNLAIVMSCFKEELNSGRLTYLGNLED